MAKTLAALLLLTSLLGTALAQAPTAPNLNVQLAAMKKLDFLIGKWSGEARQFRSGATLEMVQTEDARFKLGGLLLEIEGIGISKTSGKPALQALGIVSYDDSTGLYHMRAFNDGRWLETDVKLSGDKELTWGFAVGDYRTHSLLRINDKGEWTESHEISRGAEPAHKLMELTVRRQR